MIQRIPRTLLIALACSALISLGASIWLEARELELLQAHPIMVNLVSGIVGFSCAAIVVSLAFGWFVANDRPRQRYASEQVVKSLPDLEISLAQLMPESLTDKFGQRLGLLLSVDPLSIFYLFVSVISENEGKGKNWIEVDKWDHNTLQWQLERLVLDALPELVEATPLKRESEARFLLRRATRRCASLETPVGREPGRWNADFAEMLTDVASLMRIFDRHLYGAIDRLGMDKSNP